MPKHIFDKFSKVNINGAEVNLEGLEVDVDINHMYEDGEIISHFNRLQREIERRGRKDIGVMCAEGSGFGTIRIPIFPLPSYVPDYLVTNPIATKVNQIAGSRDTEYPYTLMIPMLVGRAHLELIAVEILDDKKNCNVFVIDSSKSSKADGNEFLQEDVAPILTKAGLKVDLRQSAFCQPMMQVHQNEDQGNVACGAYVVNNAENILDFGLDSVLVSQEVNSTPEEVMARDAKIRSEQFIKLVVEDAQSALQSSGGIINGLDVISDLEDRFIEATNVFEEELTEEETTESPEPVEPEDLKSPREEILDLTKNVISKSQKYFPEFSKEQMQNIFCIACNIMEIAGDPFEKPAAWKSAISNLGVAEPMTSRYLGVAQLFQIQLANEALDNNIFSKDGGWFKMTDVRPKELERLSQQVAKIPGPDVESPIATNIMSKGAGIGVRA